MCDEVATITRCQGDLSNFRMLTLNKCHYEKVFVVIVYGVAVHRYGAEQAQLGVLALLYPRQYGIRGA